jgi:hypothetical protein
MRALKRTIGGRPHWFVDTLNPSRVGSFHRFTSEHFPETKPEIFVATAIITKNINRWCRTGDRGTSSETIVDWLTGIPLQRQGDYDVPHDPADLARCVRLLWDCPELIDEMPRMAECSPAWARLIAGWEILIAIFLREIQRSIALGHQECPETYVELDRLRRTE